ncbi:MAG: putative LPS assembly protein LptD, partial [Crocinitomicaceae bacterium]
LREFGMSHSLSLNTQLTTTLFSYYKFIGKKEPLLRHVLTPSFTFTYIPTLNSSITDSVGVDMAPITYSPFEQSLYSSGVQNPKGQMLLKFGFNNTFELKRKSDKDTITGYKKTRIIDAFAINGSYDFFKDSMNLSDIRLSMRINPITWLNFVANSSFSPYGWVDSTGAKLSQYASATNGVLGRFASNNLSTTITFTSKESREKLKNNVGAVATNWNSDYEYYLLHPERVVSFEIPWKISLSHVYQINVNQSRSAFSPDKWNQIQTLMMNGDVSFTKRWKLVSAINFDIQTKAVTNARFGLTRDMHCWALAFNWTPIGGNKSFLFSIKSTSKLFTDAKLELRKPPAFL